MMQADNDALRIYLNRVRPHYIHLFNLAHAITGNCERAEYALQYAVTDFWAVCSTSGGHHNFREGLRSTLIKTAVKDVLSEKNTAAEFTWNGLCADGISENEPVRRILSAESTELRRIIVLRCGCALPAAKIARILRTDPNRIATLIRRFEARAMRKLNGIDRRKFEWLLARCVDNELAQPNAFLPEMGNVFRTFLAEAVSVSRTNRLSTRIVRAAIITALAAICMLVFWLAAVLMQPPVIVEENPGPAEIVQTE